MPKVESFLIPMKYISTLPEQHVHHLVYCWKNRLKITGMWMEKKKCQMHGQDSQDLSYERKGHGKDFHRPGERLTRKQATSRLDNVWPDMWKFMSDAAKKKAIQRWAIEKPKLEKCQTIQRNILYWTKRWRIQAHNESRSQESWKFRCQQQCLAKYR